MRRMLVTSMAVLFCAASLGADVTVVQTMTMEGKAAAALQPGQLPKITTRLKGQQARVDVEVNGKPMVSTMTDLSSRKVTILNHASKTMTVTTAAEAASAAAGVTLPKIDFSLTPTGKSQTFDGQAAQEHDFKMTLDMSTFSGSQMPPEAAAAMKDVKIRMSGSFWVARNGPAAQEYAKFSKAALDSNLLNQMVGALPSSGGLDKLMEAAASIQGLPYLTEITMAFEGTGPVVDVMKQMGPMKMVQKIDSVSTEAVPDEVFTVPAGYTPQK